MDTLRINTSQNIEIEQPIASVGERVVATMIDFLIMIIFSIVLAYFGGKVLQSKSMLVLGSIPILFYSLLSEAFMDGQSWGKKVMKIKVVKIDGTSTSFSNYFMRWLIGLVEVYVFFGSLALITIIINQKGQRLGDIAANSTIVRLNEKKFDKLLLRKVPETYSVVFPEAVKLKMNDIHTIEEVIDFHKSTDYSFDKVILVSKACNAIQQKLGIESKLSNIDFLETILRDYNFLNSH
jgi:uncharacterized RDD family membrane protein YckC